MRAMHSILFCGLKCAAITISFAILTASSRGQESSSELEPVVAPRAESVAYSISNSAPATTIAPEGETENTATLNQAAPEEASTAQPEVEKHNAPTLSPYPESVRVGCMAYYGFDDSDPGYDMTGNGWDGIASGLSIIPGVRGNAASFDGTAGMLVESFRNIAWGEELSISLWFRRSSQAEGGYLPIISNGLDNDASWSITSGGEEGGRVLWAKFEFGDAKNSSQSVNFMPGRAELDVWHHVALIYNHGRSYVFVDGIPQLALQEGRGQIRTMDRPLQIACLFFRNTWRRPKIDVDEIRIYNRVLSGAEINILAADTLEASSLSPSERPTVRRLSANVIPTGARAPAGQIPSRATLDIGAGSEAEASIERSREPTPSGLTPDRVTRGSAAPVEPQQPSVWWTDTKESGVQASDSCCDILDKWKNLWRTGQKQAVIDDLNRLSTSQ